MVLTMAFGAHLCSPNAIVKTVGVAFKGRKVGISQFFGKLQTYPANLKDFDAMNNSSQIYHQNFIGKASNEPLEHLELTT